MHTSRRLLATTVLGVQLSSAAVGSAQPVEPLDEPPSEERDRRPSGTEPQHELRQSSEGSTSVEPSVHQKPSARRPDKAALNEAKRAYTAGEQAYNAKDYKGAIEQFRVAQDILPTPQAGYWLALSLQADGQVPEAIAEFRTLLSSAWSDRLGPEKLGTAKAALETLNKTPGTISLSTDPAGATVSVDGEVRPGVSPLSVELQPGVHTLVVSMPGYKSTELELEVPPGSKGEQRLTLMALPPAPAITSRSQTVTAEQSQRVLVHTTGAAPATRSHVGEYVVLGLAGAGAVIGTVFGIRALRDDDKATTNDAADRDGTIAGLGLGAALTFGLAGLVMITATDGLPAGREKVVATRIMPEYRGFHLAPFTTRTGVGASAFWHF